MQHYDKTAIPAQLGAICLAVLALGTQGAAIAQTPGPAADAPATKPPVATPPATTPIAADRLVDINEYIVRGNTVLDERAIETAVTPFLGPQRSLKDIQAARDALLAAYQTKGYQSVYVDLPEQQVADGVVYLQVSETKVGRVRVVGAQYNSPLAMRDQVPALKEGAVPDFNQAQVELTALNRGGNRQVMPMVKQGVMPGTMDVDLKVDDNAPWHGSVGLTNDYSPDTKPLRLMATIGYDNLWQMGHSLSLSFFGAPQDLDQTKVFSGSYLAPIKGTNWSLELSGYTSDSNVATLGGTTVLGKGQSVGLKATYTVPNTGDWYHSLSAGIDLKNTQEALTLGGTGDSVPLKYAPITLGYSGFVQKARTQANFDLSAVTGTSSFFGFSSDASSFDNKRFKALPSFLILKGDMNGTYTFEGDEQLGLRLAGQLTDSPLVSTEQIAGGGMSSVRGYLSAEVTGDYGLVASVEMRTKPLAYLDPWVQNWRGYVFTDAARLSLKDPLPEQQSNFTLASIGFGTSFQVGKRVTGRLDFGYPLKSGPRTERHDPTLNFNVSASY
jgi:hemolysin activation/secretion protein